MVGCGKNQLDISGYEVSNIDRAKVTIPESCQEEYKQAIPSVAVVAFTNNSTFGIAEVNKANKSAVGGLAVGVGPNFIGAVAGSKSKGYNEKRKIDAKLSQAVVPVIENMIVNLGGAEIFSRNDMKKIDAELKFQDSGLIDPNSVVKFGKLSGVKYLITGSIDNVEQKYRNNEGAAGVAVEVTKNSDNKAVKYGALLAKAITSVTDGMLIKTTYTVKIIDVESGKIVFSKQINAENNIGKIPNPNYDQVIGGIKAGINKTLSEVAEDFSRFFAVKGYIVKLRAKGDKLIAQVNIGSKYGVKENTIFEVYTFEETIDPMSGKKTCDRIKMDTILKATDRITKDYTWATVDQNKNEEIKLLQLIQKTSKEGGLLNAIKF